jgi:hypothetical protein
MYPDIVLKKFSSTAAIGAISIDLAQKHHAGRFLSAAAAGHALGETILAKERSAVLSPI